jgi:hypothetical protein
MAIIRCTQKLLSELKIKPSDSDQSSNGFESWHANLLRIDRRRCVLLAHDRTLYTFLIPGMTKPHFQNFDDVFRQNLFKSLMEENLPQKHIEIFIDNIREIEISKTNNLSVLGSMNDLTFQLKYRIADEGGLLNADITKLNHDLNRTSMSAIEEIFSSYELRKVLNKMKG